MPFVEEMDLVELHKYVDRTKKINERLLDQVKIKNQELKQSKIQRNIFLSIIGIVLLGGVAISSFGFSLKDSAQLGSESNVVISVDSLNAAKARIQNLQKMNTELGAIQEFYLAKNFMNNEQIYAVQVKSFSDNKVPLTSGAITNSLFVKNNPYYSYSLGLFEKLEDARNLKTELIKMGFKDAFVASYKTGKRLRIED